HGTTRMMAHSNPRTRVNRGGRLTIGGNPPELQPLHLSPSRTLFPAEDAAPRDPEATKPTKEGRSKRVPGRNHVSQTCGIDDRRNLVRLLSGIGWSAGRPVLGGARAVFCYFFGDAGCVFP